MDKINKLSLILGKDSGVYSPSEFISGKIKIFVKEKVRINEISILIRGNSSINWVNEGKLCKDSSEFHQDETHLNINLKVESDVYLEEGKQSFAFRHQLPIDLPSSFEHSNASTRYYIRATINLELNSDLHFTKQFTVVNTHNLNDYPELKQPYGVNDFKSYLGCFGSIYSRLETEKTGFVSGEGIKFKASIDNKTNLELKDLKINLVKKLMIQAQSNSKSYDKTVALLKSEKIVSGNSNEIWKSEIYIPPLCPNSNEISKLINISYSLVFNFKTSKLMRNVQLEIPICVGSVPFKVRYGRFLHTFEPFPLEYSKYGSIPVLDGETNSNNLNKYKPLYPFYKYI